MYCTKVSHGPEKISHNFLNQHFFIFFVSVPQWTCDPSPVYLLYKSVNWVARQSSDNKALAIQTQDGVFLQSLDDPPKIWQTELTRLFITCSPGSHVESVQGLLILAACH